ncbi:MAG: tripartite tricarboxylate transporter permease [Planctomycetaceae bacterium]
MNEALTQALTDVFGRLDIWMIVISAAVYGVFVGAIPGLTATMAVALFVPMAYWLDPVAAMAAIITMVACAIFAGDLPTVFLRIPGTPSSAAYADEAFAFTKRGEAERVLGIALFCSATGGVFGAIAMMLLGSQLAKVATLFSVTEYFWLYLIGLSCAVLVASGSKAKALLSLLLGLFLSTIGLSAAHVEARFTFGIPDLYQGISFIPAMIGLFGLSEVFRNLGPEPAGAASEASHDHIAAAQLWRRSISEMARRFRCRKRDTARSSSIGVFIGMLPGAGADIAAWVSFAVSKRARLKKLQNAAAEDSAKSETVDSLDCIADATSANNAALAGSWIPALVFGIPGDSITAIVLGVLMMKNLTPGPKIFEDQATFVYSLYLIFLLANLVLVPVGFLAIRLGGRIVRIPRRILLPMIVLFCVTGSYALNGSLFDVATMLTMGVTGFLLSRFEIPLGPVVLGLILGGPLEERFVQVLTGSAGNPLALVNRPIAIVLALAFAVMLMSIIRASRRDTQEYPSRPA